MEERPPQAMGEHGEPAADGDWAELSSLRPWASAKHTFEKRKELGRGSFGVVYRAVLWTPQPGTWDQPRPR